MCYTLICGGVISSKRVYDPMGIYFYIDYATIHIGDSEMAATVQQILDVISAVRDSVANVALDVMALKDQIAAGGVVTQADLDNILAQIQDVASRASDLDASTP